MVKYHKISFNCWNCAVDYQIYIDEDFIKRVFFFDDKGISKDQYLNDYGEFVCVHCKKVNNIRIEEGETP